MINQGKDQEVIIEDIDIALAIKIVKHANRFYLSVRPTDVAFFNLKAGDTVLMKLVKVKRKVDNDSLR